jgi:uncharacterized Zn finger protein (UPF0148 family)
VSQGLLAGVTGTHLEPTGSDAKGPEVEVCDGCHMPVMYAPAVGPFACPTPEVHTSTGEAPEEDDMETEEESTPITAEIADEIAKQVDAALAFAGEGGDDPKAIRAAIDHELGQGDFERWPTKRGKQVEFIEQLAGVVMEGISAGAADRPPDEPKTGPRTVKEGWDETSDGPPIIRIPIGS